MNQHNPHTTPHVGDVVVVARKDGRRIEREVTAIDGTHVSYRTGSSLERTISLWVWQDWCAKNVRSQEPSQIAVAHELLRGALDLLTRQKSSRYILNVLEQTTKANGGGDGYTLAHEIEDYFDQYEVARDFQWPDENA